MLILWGSMLGSLQQSLLSDGGGDEAEEREGAAQWWGYELAGPLPLYTEER